MTINYSKQVLLKRGNTAVSSTYTGPVGEITLDTDLLQLRVHDGTTQGGWVIPSGQDFIDIQNDLAVIANVDTSLLANVSTLLANANVQQTQIDSLNSNAASQQTQLNNLVTVGNTAPGTANETFWFNTDDGRLYIKQANVWTDASPTVLPSPEYIFGTLENTAGNIVPDASNVYSLGSSVAQWKDIWVSNATIYFNSVPLSTDVSGNLTYNGNPLVSLIDGNLSVGGAAVGLNPFDQDLNANSAVTFYTVGATAINVSQINGTNPGDELIIQAGGSKNWNFGADGHFTLPYGSRLVTFDSASVELTAGNNNNSYSSLASFNGNSYVWVDDNGAYVGTNWNSGAKTWTFGTDGNLTFPGNSITIGNVYGAPSIISAPDTPLQMASSGNNAYTVLGWLDDLATSTQQAIVVTNNPLYVGEGDVGIITGNTPNVEGGTGYIWNFTADGNLIFPTGGNLIFDSSATSVIDGVTNITANGNVTAAQYNFANGVNILDTITGVTSINSSVATSTISDESGDFSYGSLSYDYAVNGVTSGGFTISYSAPLVHGNVDVNVGNVIATNISVSGNLTVDNTLVNRVYLLEAYASETYTLPGSFTEDVCRYSVVSANVNVPSAWFNTSTYTFTPLKAGYWEITAAYDVYRNAESSMAIKKNTTIVASAGSFNAVAQQVTKIIYLNGSTDYIQIYNYGGAALERSQYETRSWFQARWVGA